MHLFGFRDDASEFPTSEQIKFRQIEDVFKKVCAKKRRLKCSRNVLVVPH